MLTQCEGLSFAQKLFLMKRTFILLFICLPVVSMAQGWAPNTYDQLGTWQTLNVKYEAHPKINWFAEGQFRSQEFYNDINYWEVKTFAHYIFTDQFAGGLGVGTYHQYMDYENFSTPQKQSEVRAWLEFTMKSNGGRVNFDHRFRFEDRFIRKWNTSTQGFDENYSSLAVNDDDRYRFRYRIQANVPLNHKTMTKSTFYFNVSDEVMFTHKAPFFNQNRFFTGLGYKMNTASIQIGMMHQFLHLNTSERRKDYFQITFSKVIHRAKQ